MKLDIGLNLKAKTDLDDVDFKGKEFEANMHPEKYDIDMMEVCKKPEKEVIEVFDPSNSVHKRVDFITVTWQQKLQLGVVMLFIIVYFGLLIRGFIYEVKRMRNVKHMMDRMRPIVAALLKMDQNVAKQVQREVSSYTVYSSMFNMPHRLGALPDEHQVN